MSYTKGPWIVKEQGDANDYCLINTDKDWLLAFRHNGVYSLEQQRENIKLISTSPDLLNACIMARNAIASLAQTSEPAQNCLEAIDNAINKAII